MSQAITFQSKPFTAQVPENMKQMEDNLVAHSNQAVIDGGGLKERFWILKNGDDRTLLLAKEKLGICPEKLNVEKEFTATLDQDSVFTLIQFYQGEGEVGEALQYEGALQLVEVEKPVGGYSYKQILGAVSVLALLALGATYLTGTFPFNAQKA